MIGKLVKVVIDRPLGSVHPNHKEMRYPVNYGYIEGIIAGDGEEQDAYILGVDDPLTTFEGAVIAVIHRKNDVEDKWVVAPQERAFSRSEILEAVNFQEQFYDIELIM